MSSYQTPASVVRSKKRTASTLTKSSARRKLTYGAGSKKLQVYRPVRAFNQVGFPKTLKFIHKYCDNVAVSGSAGIPFKYQFSCNGLYDPNITGTGHQPMYFDQVTPIYNQYRVIGAKARGSFSTGSGTTVPYIFGCYIDDDTTAFVVQTEILEQKSCSWTSISPATPYMGNITKTWSAKSNFGPSNVDQNMQGGASSNPTEQQYFTFFGYAQDITSAVAGWLTVEIEYIAIWNELKTVASS